MWIPACHKPDLKFWKKGRILGQDRTDAAGFETTYVEDLLCSLSERFSKSQCSMCGDGMGWPAYWLD